VELRLEIAKARLAQQNLQKLIKELQEATVDVSKELHDWQRRSDAVIGRKVRAGIAVVSAK
jgi:FtsZ-binding cell division protein ZapB